MIHGFPIKLPKYEQGTALLLHACGHVTMHAYNHTRVLERDCSDECELVLKAAKSGVKGKSVRILSLF